MFGREVLPVSIHEGPYKFEYDVTKTVVHLGYVCAQEEHQAPHHSAPQPHTQLPDRHRARICVPQSPPEGQKGAWLGNKDVRFGHITAVSLPKKICCQHRPDAYDATNADRAASDTLSAYTFIGHCTNHNFDENHSSIRVCLSKG